jgi:plasmid stabilization system protein ParE
VKLVWSADALADLDRFAAFLHEHHPELAGQIAHAILAETSVLVDHPALGRPLAGRPDLREIVLRVLNASYILQYRLEGDRIIMLRAFHGRERR